eukprot:symbB.v1.2.029154.t1/scaffold3143.1/size62517/3
MESYPLHSFSLGGSVSPCSPTSGVPSGAGASANRTGDKTTKEDVVHTNTMGGAIKRICEQLEGLTQLQQSVKEVQQSLSLLQGSVLFQDKTLEQVRLLLVDRGTKSWDMSQDFSSEVAVAPSQDPPLLPVVPGQVAEKAEKMGESSPQSANRDGNKNVRFEKPSRKKKGPLIRKASTPMLRGGAATLNELEAATAHELLGLGPHRNGGRSSSRISESTAKQSFGSRNQSSGNDLSDQDSVLVNVDELKAEPTLAKSSNQSHGRSTLQADREGVLKVCRRLSLDELQYSHDAHLARTQVAEVSATSTKRPLPTLDTDADSMVCAARFWLLFVGILGFRNTRAGSWWFLVISLPLLAQIACLIYFTATGKADFYRTGITLCLMLGSTVAAWSMRRAEIHLLLGHEDGGLEEYARKSGFLKEWRQISRTRLKEVLLVLFVMLSCRWLAVSFTQPSLAIILIAVSFSSTAVGCAAVTYTQLHIVAGMDLAIDSFCIHFFKEMDLEQALGEWNTVQATLRQVSTKLSRSMLALGASCGASLLLLAEYTFFHSESALFDDQLQPGLQMCFFLGWLFPPVFLFLYSMMRAAGVTEKASRVAPLVNSWHFGDQDDENVPSWMDLGRQYIVQYMIQSQAGFYVQGVRLHAFQVTKLSYYFAAFIFAVLSKATNL